MGIIPTRMTNTPNTMALMILQITAKIITLKIMTGKVMSPKIMSPKIIPPTILSRKMWGLQRTVVIALALGPM
jgi:hypothetical protein